MFLKHINYYENKGKSNFWQINDVTLHQSNLIVGINATGKTRLFSVITNFAQILAKKSRMIGHFEFEFTNKEKDYSYQLEIGNDNGVTEELKRDNRVLLQREKGEGKLFSNIKGKLVKFSPPENELTINVRRDTKEYPYLEDLINWANNVLSFSFSGASPLFISTSGDIEAALKDFRLMPFLINELIEKTEYREAIIDDLNKIGYEIEEVKAIKRLVQNSPKEFLLASIKEKNVECFIEQTQMSQGLFRALTAIVVIEHIIQSNRETTVLIDDLGEGLDFSRSMKLTELILNKIAGKRIQLIITSNDRFLINNFNMEDINILEREGQNVKAYNYSNSKELFDEFKLTGLNNFDLFSSRVKI